MENNEFNFYNSENDGYRGSFGEYVDPTPAVPNPEGPENRKKPGRGFSKKVVALVLACAIVGGGAGVGGAALYQNLSRGGTVIYEGNRPTVQTMVNNNNGEPMTPEQLYAANLASCVGITVNTTVNIFGQTTTSAATGSGFVLTQDGYIVTNYHVIEDAANDSSVSIEVSFADGTKYTAQLVGGEQDNDIAVLKIDATGLQHVTLGNSSQLVVGESVYAIGNPLGELTYTLTDGIVSALDRLITTSSQDANGNTVSTTLNVLQTNCAINPGNSGGPLFNMKGEVVGITTAKFSGSTSSGASIEGIGFAIPIDDVMSMIDDLKEFGYLKNQAYLGVTVLNMDPRTASMYSLPSGSFVQSVVEGGCAQKAGLQAKDIIIAVGDYQVDSNASLTSALRKFKAGDTTTIKVFRAGQEVELTITFDEKPQVTEPQQEQTVQTEPQSNVPQGQDPSAVNPFDFFFGGQG